MRSKSFRTFLPPAILFLSLLGLYLRTLAPGLSWAHAGGDGGDLITAAATGGIAHPTGYPLYLLLARLFQRLPLGTLAYRTNLMSALFMALAAVLVYGLVVRPMARGEGTPAWPGGLAAGYAFGLAPLVWSQALITEVYALQAFLIGSILHLYATPRPALPESQARLDGWRGFLLGLAMGNHLTTVLLAPAALLLGCVHEKAGVQGSRPAPVRFDTSAFLRQLSWFGLGLSVYAVLLLRALSGSPVNWGNPITPGRLWWLVSGQLYQEYLVPAGLAGAWEGLRAWAALLLEQVGLPGIVLGFLGLVLFSPEEWAAGWRVSRLSLLAAWMALVFSLFAILYRSADSYVYLVPVVISFALWTGAGVHGVLALFPPAYGWARGSFLLMLAAVLLLRAMAYYRAMDASHDTRAEDFARAVLSEAPENALLFAEGDQAVFALWYAHFALGERPDLAVIASDLLHFDWYLERLGERYPSLVLPGPLPFPQTVALANPVRPVCQVRYTGRTEMACALPAATSP